MNNLVIDIGNTYSKIAVFENRELIYFEQYRQVTAELLKSLLRRYRVENSSVSSVGATSQKTERYLSEYSNFKPFSTQITGNIRSNYQSRDTLGLDRWAKVIAAHCLFTGRNNFMIDAGTCITYDLLTSSDEYMGGNISLGLNMRFQALHHFTKRLPLLKLKGEMPDNEPGTTTTTAIQTGVLRGALHEIEGFIQEEHNRYEDLQIIFTGGDSIFLTKQLKNSIFAHQIIHEPYLVLKGLNEAITLKNE